jgi:hypothetical protein
MWGKMWDVVSDMVSDMVSDVVTDVVWDVASDYPYTPLPVLTNSDSGQASDLPPDHLYPREVRSIENCLIKQKLLIFWLLPAKRQRLSAMR